MYIQMDLYEEILQEWITKTKVNEIPEPVILVVLQQIFSGVHYIHSKKVVHHDIKVI